MDFSLLLFMLLGFLFIFLLIEATYLFWRNNKSADVQQLRRRLRNLSAGQHGLDVAALLRKDSLQGVGLWQTLLLSLPRVSVVDKWLEQADLDMSLTRFLGFCLLFPCSVVLVLLALRFQWFGTLVAGFVAAFVPFVWLSWRRNKRLQLLDSQLADAVEFIARAMRAGHAFSSALQMVGDEGAQPIASEFKLTAEEINYGVPIDAALANMTRRFPSDDLRYFSTAVLLQKETGGNLAEILDNISTIIRERYKLLGKVKVLATEGKLSAYILITLPFATAALVNIVSPKFMEVLWKDPVGLKVLYAVAILMSLGIVWMSRIVKIRV
jgi:tight adherence protein B